MPGAQENPIPPTRGQVVGTVTFYMVAALSMVVANKWVLKVTDVPLFFLTMQLFIATILFAAAHAMGVLVVPLRMKWEVCKGLWAMIGLNILGLGLTNYTLKYVDASFYQVARGLVLPFTVGTSFYFLGTRPSLRIIMSCGVVTAGFFIGVFLDGTNVSFLGVFFGVSSSMTTAMHAVVIKDSLKIVNNSALDLSWYTNAVSAVLLIPLVVIAGEGPGVMALLGGVDAAGKASPDYVSTFLSGSAITGSIGFLMSIAALLSIKVTSPITHMISAAVRGVAASFLGVWIFDETMSSGRMVSIATILGGSLWYTWIKHEESQQASRATNASYDRVPLEDLEAGKGEQT